MTADSVPPLIDTFGRLHTNLRISVTDRCNIRCQYCMPTGEVTFLPRAELLTFEEIARFVAALAPAGVERVRLTGGEPLLRTDLARLVGMLAAVTGVRDLALTTNGMLLTEHAAKLRAAGLRRLNISLDTLDPDSFVQISRRPGLSRVLAGIDAALDAGFQRVRLNTVLVRGLNEVEVVPLVAFAVERGIELRFIETMPLDAAGAWRRDGVVPGVEVRARVEEAFGPLSPLDRSDPSQPAIDFALPQGQGTIGFINPVTEPFCGDCNRLRLTAEGQVRNCLFSTEEWDARGLLRSGASDADLLRLVRVCIGQKRAGHGIDDPQFLRPARAMYQIGG